MKVTLLAPNEEFAVRALSVKEPFALGGAERHPVRHIARDAKADWVQDSLAWVDPDGQVVHTTGGVELAYDGSEGAKAAIQSAGRLFPGHSAVVVSVWHSTAAASAASLIAIPAGVATSAYQELDKESERQATERAHEGADAAKDAGLDATASALCSHGQVWAAIVDAADREDARAIVVGSRGLSVVKSALLGSVANGVVHHSTRPVVVIPSTVN